MVAGLGRCTGLCLLFAVLLPCECGMHRVLPCASPALGLMVGPLRARMRYIGWYLLYCKASEAARRHADAFLRGRVAFPRGVVRTHSHPVLLSQRGKRRARLSLPRCPSSSPARSATVIAVLRWLLTLPPLWLSPRRRLLHTRGTPCGTSCPRWPASWRCLKRIATSWPVGQPCVIPEVADTPCQTGMQVRRKHPGSSRSSVPWLDAAIGTDAVETALVRSAPVLPLREGWPALQRALEAGTAVSDGQRFVSPDTEVGAECSSSDSDDD